MTRDVFIKYTVSVDVRKFVLFLRNNEKILKRNLSLHFIFEPKVFIY